MKKSVINMGRNIQSKIVSDVISDMIKKGESFTEEGIYTLVYEKMFDKYTEAFHKLGYVLKLDKSKNGNDEIEIESMSLANDSYRRDQYKSLFEDISINLRNEITKAVDALIDENIIKKVGDLYYSRENLDLRVRDTVYKFEEGVSIFESLDLNDVRDNVDLLNQSLRSDITRLTHYTLALKSSAHYSYPIFENLKNIKDFLEKELSGKTDFNSDKLLVEVLKELLQNNYRLNYYDKYGQVNHLQVIEDSFNELNALFAEGVNKKELLDFLLNFNSLKGFCKSAHQVKKINYNELGSSSFYQMCDMISKEKTYSKTK